ncbi:MAG: family 16 glycoside hydrolase [Opitutaceae bacterium]
MKTTAFPRLGWGRGTWLVLAGLLGSAAAGAQPLNAGGARKPESARALQVIRLDGRAGGRRFDGIGVVDGGGATSVLLKDYPEPKRRQILDLVFKPKFGASVSALYVEIPGDGNSTQGSMPSHMHTRGDLDYSRGYIWWIMREARMRNPGLTLDANVWSAPGWIGHGDFWSQDGADYDLKWLQGLRKVYGLELDAIGCRNERGVSYPFAKMLRATLDAHGFGNVRIHAFDNWQRDKLDFVKDMFTDPRLRKAIGIISAHTLSEMPASARDRAMADALHKPIWDTEEHVYRKGFACEIGIVRAFNLNYLLSGATKIVNWYGIAGLYPLEPYSHDPAMLIANSPWSGHYRVREALWGYAHYGQFTQIGWEYLNGGCGELARGGTFVTLKSPGGDYSVIIETEDAKEPQRVRFQVRGGLSRKRLGVWFSDAREQFVRLPGIDPENGGFTVTLQPGSIYSITTTRGQRKGSYDRIPARGHFPFPYYETFDEYSAPKEWGCLPRYTADIAGAFEIAERPDGKGKCLRQVVSTPPISWAPEGFPYTILGSERWSNYAVSADVYLNPGDSAGVMGRISSVGTGYGCEPEGYLLQLGAEGRCRVEVCRGDAAGKSVADPEGGGRVLGGIRLAHIGPGQWHNLKLRFDGARITAWVDGRPVLTVTDSRYSRGMAGLMAGCAGGALSTPYFDNVLIKGLDAPVPAPTPASLPQTPIYGPANAISGRGEPCPPAASGLRSGTSNGGLGRRALMAPRIRAT